MKSIFRISCLLLLMGTVSSCLKYDDLRENPNDPNKVPPSLLFTQVTPGPISSFSDDYMYAQYHLWSAVDNAASLNYRFGTSSMSYSTLRNIDKMEKEAAAANAPVYSILAKFKL